MKPTKNIPHRFEILLPICALLTAAAGALAQTNTWTGAAGDNNWATPGNWSLTLAPTTGETPAFGATGAGGLTLNNNLTAGTSFLGLDFNVGAPSFILNGNSITMTGGIFDYSTSLETINFDMAFASASQSLYATSGGALVVNGSISDGGGGYGITIAGGGSVSLAETNDFIGTTTVNAGTLELDFNALGISSGGTLSNNIINPGSALSLGGGTLDLNGSSTLTNSQTFASTTLAAGSSVVQVAPASGTVTISNNLALGALTYTAGTTVMFVGPAYSQGVTTASGQSGAYGNQNSPANTGFVTATANVTTSSGGVNTELTGSSAGVSPGSGTSAQAAFATVGLYDFAIVVGSSPYTIIGASQGTAQTGTATGADELNGTDGAYTLVTPGGQFGGSSGGSGGPVDVYGTAATRNTDSLTALRVNAPGATTLTGSTTWSMGGILITPNVGQNNVTITTGLNAGLRSGSNPGSVVLWQNNVGGILDITGVVGDGKTAGAAYVHAGPGTVVYTGVNTFTGQTYMNGGITEIYADSGLGAVATGATVNLNGGTVFGGATLTLDNSGASKRSISLGVAGGGLSASSNTFMTVGGVISGAAGTGPLWIGIPATSANGGVAGLLPGTGNNTANSTATNATGLVVLTGANTYTGGTILYSGTLNFTSASLGTGGITFNGGGLQWAAGTILDISSQTVSIGSAGGTVDINGNNVTLANSIGNSGSGALAVTNTGGASVALTLKGSNTYTGGTTVETGATLIAANTSGSATGTGPVTVQSGATLEGPGTISGAVTVLAGGVYDPVASGVGTAVVGSLTSDASSVYDIQFSGTSNSEIVVANSGGLVLNGGAFNLAGLPGTGTYDLIQYSGSVGGSGLDSAWTTPSDANPHIENPNAAYLYSFSLSGGYLTVTVSPNLSAVISAWTNNVNSTWSAAANWSPNRVPHSPGDAATFGVSTGLRTVTLDANESVGSVTFTNANSFVVAGSGNALTLDNSGATANINVTAGAANGIQTGIALNSPVQVSVGSGDYLGISGSISNENDGTPQTVLANGVGTLALSGNNSYGPGSGSLGTTLTGGGTMQVGSVSALGTSDLAVTGNSTLQAGASVSLANNIDISPAADATVDTHGNNLALNGTISDTGNLTKIGVGTLTLGGFNASYNGLVRVDAGTLSISSDENLGADNPIVLNGGDLTGTGNVQIYRGINIGLAAGSVGTNAFIDAAGGSTIEFSIAGGINSAGNLGVNNLTVNGNGGNGIVELQGAGTFNGSTVVAGGTLDVANSGALQDSLLNYNNQGGVLTFDSSINAATFAGLSGAQSLALTNTSDAAVALTLDGSTSTTYSGSLNDYATGGSLTLTGSATLTMTGSNTMTGELTVDSGELELTNNGSVTCSTLQGGEFLVAGGTLITTSATGTSTLAGTGLVETAGLVQSAGFIRENADGSFIEIAGGAFISSNVNLTRTFANATAPTATAPIAAQTTTGFYVTNANASVPTAVALGTLSIGTGNSSATVRMDGGTFTVTNEVEVGSISAGSTRWTVLQVNGGTFTSLDTNYGLVLSQNNAGSANDAEVYLSGGTTYAGIINFGLASDTAGGNGVVIVTNSLLYMGSGGIDMSNNAGYEPIIYLESGILGATADWSSTIPGDGFSYGLLLPIAGNSFIIQAADANNVPHNISFVAGGLGGPGNLVKTGGGTLALGGYNAFTGTTTVSAGTLALAGDGATTGLLQGTAAINIVAPGVVSVAGLPDDTLHVGDNNVGESVQSLTGNGLVSGNVTLGTQGALAPGASPASFGNFMITGSLTNEGALILKVDHPGTGATNDSVSAQSITNLAASTLTVTQGTNDLVTGDTFKLLNITGNNGVSSTTNLLLTLPLTGPVSGVTYVWNTNNLAVNGTIKLTTGGAPSIPTTPTNLIFSVSSGVLHISWPPSYLGWSLQSNSVSLALTNDWFTIPGSSAVTNENIALPASGSVFFRMYNN